MMLHIPEKSHGFFYHMMMNARGIKHVKSILMPTGYANMGRIQSFFIGNNNNNITIMDRLSKQTRIGYFFFRNVAIYLSIHTTF
jgi:hypothetical protein